MFQKTLFSVAILWMLSFSNCKQVEKSDSNQNETSIQPDTNYLFIGTYTKKEGHVDGKAAGIYLYAQNSETGALTYHSVTKNVINPSFLTLSFDGNFLYAVNETGADVGSTGSVSAFAIDPATKALRLLNTQSSHSFAPCHISVDRRRRFVFLANYVGGKVVVLPIKDDGSLGEASDVLTLVGKKKHPRQDSSHPHSIFLSADERFAYVPDLGTDKIMIYTIDYENGKLLPNEMPFVEVADGSGPRHFAFHPGGKLAFVINELNNTVTSFEFDPDTGKLKIMENTPTLPADFKENNLTADIHVSPDGKFLYASNRGHDSIVVFKIDEDTGKLTLIEHESTRGVFPRNFMITEDGKFLYAANQNSNNISLFKIESDGSLTFVEQVNVPTPVCLKML